MPIRITRNTHPIAAKPDLCGSLSYWLQRLIPFRQPIGRHRASGLRLQFGRRDDVGRHILRYQTYEPAISAWLFGWLAARTEPGLFIDIGANIGWFSLNAARLPVVSQVLAFEPDAGNHQLLCENLALNGVGERVLPIACALGARRGFALLHRYRASNRGRHSLLQAYGEGQSLVAVDALDTLLNELGHTLTPIHAIKLDVEGYEPAVLAGALETLARVHVLVIELSPALSAAGGLDFSAMLAVLASAGFVPQAWDRAGDVPNMSGLADCAGQCTVVLMRELVSPCTHL